jgi:hypothetical protein
MRQTGSASDRPSASESERPSGSEATGHQRNAAPERPSAQTRPQILRGPIDINLQLARGP